MIRFNINKSIFYLFLLFTVCFCAVALFGVIDAHAKDSEKDYVEGQAIICVKGGEDSFNNSLQNNNCLDCFVIESLGKLSTSNEFQETLIKNPSQTNKMITNNDSVLNIDSGNDTSEMLLVGCDNTDRFIQSTKNCEFVLWAQPNYIYHADDNNLTEAQAENVDEKFYENFPLGWSSEETKPEETYNRSLHNKSTSADENISKNANYIYNDEFYKYQWGFDRSEFGVSSDIEAEKAWANGAGDSKFDDVVVAVMDSGVDYTHNDLKNVIWSDGEKYPSLIETFGSGAHGVNTVPDEDSSDPMDIDNGHGSHCAGAIAAEADNDYGTVGVNSKNAKIMGCRWMKDGKGQTSEALKAYNYVIAAKKVGVNVYCASNSWGAGVSTGGYDYALENILIEAGKVGIVSCFAAGNSNLDLDGCPNLLVDNPYVIFVGASNDNGNAAAFSNYGKHTVDVFSPGVHMLNTVNVSESSSLKQYLPRLQPETDNWFYENFNTDEPKVKLLTHKYTELENTHDDAFVDLDKGQIKIPLNHYEIGDKVCAQISVDKQYLQELIASRQNPYISLMYGTTKNSLDGKALCNLLYVDKNAENPEPKLAPLSYKLYNSYMNVISATAIDTKYLNTDYNCVDIEVAFDIVNNDADSYFFIDDFGLGKKCSEFYFMSGTSMACPVCSGIISEVCSHLKPNSAQDVLDVLACIKGGVNHCDTNSEILDKSITQGIVSLNNSFEAAKVLSKQSSSLENVSPVLQDFKNNQDGTATVSGYFFSNDAGNLYIDGKPVEILNWTDSQIKFRLNYISNDKENYLAEFRVVRNDGNYNREFFELGSASESGYVNVGMSNIEYTNAEGKTFTANDLNPVLSASTNNYFYCIFADDQDTIVMEKYNFATNQWSNVDISSLNLATGSLNSQCQLTAGYDELYMLYTKKTQLGNKIHLVTFSEKENRFINDVDVDDYAQLGDILGFYNGELMLIRADALTQIFPEIQVRDTDIVKIYADTGRIFENVGNYADFLEGDKDPYIACGRVSSYGGKMYITDSIMTATPELLEMFGRKIDDIYNGVIVFDGKTFKRGESLNNNYTLIDQGQTNCSSSYGISNGAITVGMVKNNGDANMVDTYNYSWNANGQWVPVNNNFDSFKTTSITAACHDNKFYVLGHRGLENKGCFKYLDLKILGLDSENPSANAKKESANPVPVPGENPTIDNAYSSVLTADNIHIGFWPLIFLLVFASTMIIYHRYRNSKCLLTF